MNNKILPLLVANFAFAALSFGQGGYKPYTAFKQILVSGNGNWDYLSVDAVNRRLYLSHGEKVDVVDIDRDALVGSINNQHGVHGIAVATPENKGFISTFHYGH